MHPVAKFCLILALILTAAPAQGNKIQNPGFELASTFLEGFPAQFRVWGGDQSVRVFTENGITPLAGNQMLRFESTGVTGSGESSSSEIYQLIDVSSLAPSGQTTVDASMFANRVAGADVDTRFFLRLYAFEGTPDTFGAQLADEAYLQFDQAELLSDADLDSWEELSLSVSVPSNATFLALAVVANENVVNDIIDEFAGHYADEVSMTVTRTVTASVSSWSKVKAVY